MYVISFNNINICILLKHTTVAAQLKKKFLSCTFIIIKLTHIILHLI